MAKGPKPQPFRYFQRHIIKKQGNCPVSLKELQELWDEQDGKCPYTGLSLILPYGTKGF